MSCNVYYIEDHYLKHISFQRIIVMLNGAGCQEVFTNGHLLQDKNWLFAISEYGTDAVWLRPLDQNQVRTAKRSIQTYLTSVDWLLKAATDPCSVMLLDVKLSDLPALSTQHEEDDGSVRNGEQKVCDEIILRLREGKSVCGIILDGRTLLNAQQCNDALFENDALRCDWDTLEGVGPLEGLISALLAGIRKACDLPFLFASRWIAAGSPGESAGACGYVDIPSADNASSEPCTYNRAIETAATQIRQCCARLNKYHADPAINKALRMIATPWVENGWEAADEVPFWHHDHYGQINNNSGPNKCYSSQYYKLGNQWLGRITVLAGEIQALTARGRTTHGTQGSKQYGTRSTSPADRKTITHETLSAVLATLEIQNGNAEGDWAFPVTPGLAFLLALKEFLLALEDGGLPGPKSVQFIRKAGAYQVMISLNENQGDEFALRASYQTVDRLNTNGLARALDNVLCARLETERGPAHRRLLVNPNLGFDWLKVFCQDGEEQPVSVEFIPYGVIFSWS